VAVLTILFVFTLAWHSKLGVEVVIEDYVQGKGAKAGLLMVNTFIHAGAGSRRSSPCWFCRSRNS
jgi:succinate dehydrogenase / fumarate reductase membrane anchor subunit